MWAIGTPGYQRGDEKEKKTTRWMIAIYGIVRGSLVAIYRLSDLAEFVDRIVKAPPQRGASGFYKIVRLARQDVKFWCPSDIQVFSAPPYHACKCLHNVLMRPDYYAATRSSYPARRAFAFGASRDVSLSLSVDSNLHGSVQLFASSSRSTRSWGCPTLRLIVFIHLRILDFIVDLNRSCIVSFKRCSRSIYREDRKCNINC